MNLKRARLLKKGSGKYGPVVYWMSRDQRLNDNWALVFASDYAKNLNVPLLIIFCLTDNFLGAGLRHYDFMLKSLKEVYLSSLSLNIPFIILKGNPVNKIPDFINNISASALITDFDPLRVRREWKHKISSLVDTDIYEVDSHNIVPCWLASDKKEFGAYTLRPKIKRLLDNYLDEYPYGLRWLKSVNRGKDIKLNINMTSEIENADNKYSNTYPDNIIKELNIDKNIPPVEWIKPGCSSAVNILGAFLKRGIFIYNEKRNDPNKDAQSNLSPFIHFGQLSAQRIALEVLKLDIDEKLKEPFLEELIVRRELSDNFCFYNNCYDAFDGFPDWAKNSLHEHWSDKRTYIYTTDEFENCKTNDELWNAAQMEMAKTGKMHGYMRMYWAKKILEWTETPEHALQNAIYLNDRYSLDGRDPNGYAGIAWSIGGVHDRAWSEREVFGKIRYMSHEGCKRKFDVNSYINTIKNL